MNENQNSKWAKIYAQEGLAVIPIGQRNDGQWKKPVIKGWRTKPTPLTLNEIEQWWSQYPELRVGIITGCISKLIVVDIDPRNGGDPTNIHLPPTLISRTGGGGWHYYYSHPQGTSVPTKPNVFPGIDIEADGGLVIAPPSLHHSGNNYEWVTEFDTKLVAPCPEWIVKLNEFSAEESITKENHESLSRIRKGDPLQKAINAPIDRVIREVASMVNIKIDYQSNHNGSLQIIENGEITSGFISSNGNFCSSSSGKARKGNPITVAKYYLNILGGHDYSRSEIIKIINNIRYDINR